MGNKFIVLTPYFMLVASGTYKGKPMQMSGGSPKAGEVERVSWMCLVSSIRIAVAGNPCR